MINLLRRITLIFLITNIFYPLKSQEVPTKEFIRSVQDADLVYLYDENYEKAAGLYKTLLSAHPGNANLEAKLGICYLNNEGRKMDALKLLKQASANVASQEDYVFYGPKAQSDTYIYLAEAYQMNDSLDKAISTYNIAKKTLGKFDAPQLEYIDKQIGSCYYALEMKKKPVTVVSDFFIPWLKNYPGASNPVLARNDSVFVFTQKTGEKTRIMCSYKTKGQWSLPSNITNQLGGMDRFYTNSITGDGRLLVLFLDDGRDGNLYFSQRKDTTWTKIKSPGKPINTIYWESHGFITPDGKSIYISSNRPDGFGDLDIWVSEKQPDGTWGEVVNCGERINTSYDEDYPFFDPANNALIFSSKGHVSMGGYDVFRSTKKYDTWTNPVGLPFAFNTTADNTFFILNNNAPGFVISRFDDKSNSRNIYGVVGIDPTDEITTAEGVVTLKDGLAVDPSKAAIKLTDIKKKTPAKTIPVNANGTFKFDIVPGDYELYVSHPGYKTDTVDISLPLYNLSHYMVINPSLIPEKVAEGSFLTIRNILFAFDKYNVDDSAKSVLEIIRPVLISHPDLKIEVAGYTDAIGSSAYNIKLADKRAQSVIDYLVSAAVPASRFVKTAFGESNFTAINSNRDGSDNPEGRKYNRRVTFGIIDPQTGVVLRQETYTPERLRLPSSIKYSVVIKKSADKLSLSQFDNLKLDGMLVVKPVEVKSGWIYTIGLFYNAADARKYLEYLKGKGYNDAYIVNQYDLYGVSKSDSGMASVKSTSTGSNKYTVQVVATRKPVDIGSLKGISKVKEILGQDGYFRYVSGEYSTYSDAKKALDPIIQAGFKDAFIRELDLPLNK
jgi:outer membrane protein OmpA-like peptidoglycan-associated protein